MAASLSARAPAGSIEPGARLTTATSRQLVQFSPQVRRAFRLFALTSGGSIFRSKMVAKHVINGFRSAGNETEAACGARQRLIVSSAVMFFFQIPQSPQPCRTRLIWRARLPPISAVRKLSARSQRPKAVFPQTFAVP